MLDKQKSIEKCVGITDELTQVRREMCTKENMFDRHIDGYQIACDNRSN